MDRTPLVVAAIAALALATVVTGCASQPAAGPTAPDTVTVRGTGTALSAPDEARLVFSTFAENADPKAAMTAAGRSGETIVAALRKAGLDEKDLRTTGVTLRPQYAYREGAAPRVTGYRADIAVQATIRDLDKLADVISAGTSAGALEVQGPAFELSEDNPLRFEALEKAVADAKARGEAMAEAGGRKLGAVVRMSDSSVQAQPSHYYADARVAASEMAAVPAGAIQPGQLEMTAEVVIEYSLR